MMEEIYICNGKATNHCRAYDENGKFKGKHLIEIDNILCSGISNKYVTVLAEKICDIINEDIKNGIIMSGGKL